MHTRQEITNTLLRPHREANNFWTWNDNSCQNLQETLLKVAKTYSGGVKGVLWIFFLYDTSMRSTHPLNFRGCGQVVAIEVYVATPVRNDDAYRVHKGGLTATLDRPSRVHAPARFCAVSSITPHLSMRFIFYQENDDHDDDDDERSLLMILQCRPQRASRKNHPPKPLHCIWTILV